MMKNPIFWPLMSLLLVAVTIRESSALALARGVTTSGPTVNGTTANNIIEGIDHLTKLFTWLQDNMISSLHFHETIENLTEDISNLPSELSLNRREILTYLYISQDQFHSARLVLNEAAILLKSYCENILDIIQRQKPSGDLLHYTGEKVASYLDLANEVLKNALSQLIELRDDFSRSKELFIQLNLTLNSEAEKINERNENNTRISLITVIDDKEEMASDLCLKIFGEICPFTNTFTHIINPADTTINVSLPIPAVATNLEIDKNLVITIGKAQELISALFSNFAKINDYIEMEIDMINIQHSNLLDSISEPAGISIEVIEFKFESLKVSITALKNACTNYIRNEKL